MPTLARLAYVRGSAGLGSMELGGMGAAITWDRSPPQLSPPGGADCGPASTHQAPGQLWRQVRWARRVRLGAILGRNVWAPSTPHPASHGAPREPDDGGSSGGGGRCRQAASGHAEGEQHLAFQQLSELAKILQNQRSSTVTTVTLETRFADLLMAHGQTRPSDSAGVR
jgi:hypothetical protein